MKCSKCKKKLELWLGQYWHDKEGWILCSKGGNHNPVERKKA